jgi:hypothetical protein
MERLSRQQDGSWLMRTFAERQGRSSGKCRRYDEGRGDGSRGELNAGETERRAAALRGPPGSAGRGTGGAPDRRATLHRKLKRLGLAAAQ